MKVSTAKVTQTEISIVDEGAWARVRYSEPASEVVILSDYGHWSYCGWGRHGRSSMAAFLAEINMDYAAGKFLGADSKVFDAEETVRYVRNHILECRREAGVRVRRKSSKMSPERARFEWELAEEISGRSYDTWAQQTSIDPYEISQARMVNPSWQNFWERLWEPGIRPELRRLAGGVTS
jgi:hypothetical protein